MRTRRIRSWYSPGLDGIGDWPVPELRPDDILSMDETLQAAARLAIEKLHTKFGASGQGFGADTVAHSMAKVTRDPGRAFALARAATGLDYYFHRASPPRCKPGGLANPRNRRIWKRLEPHIRNRLHAVLPAGAADSIFWRTVFDRIPRNWFQGSAIQRALENQFVDTGIFISIQMETDLRLPETGGDAWTATHSERSLEEIESLLSSHRPCLVEIIRGTVRSPTSADIVVVYSMRFEGDATLRLSCFDPYHGVRKDLLVERTNADLHFREPDLHDDVPSVKAMRIWDFEPATPPLFGLRRRLDAVLPWRLFWHVRRFVALLVIAGRGEK